MTATIEQRLAELERWRASIACPPVMLGDTWRSDADRLTSFTAGLFGISKHKLISVSQTRECSAGRAVLWWCIKQLHPEVTLMEMERQFGFDHSSIIYGIRRVESGNNGLREKARIVMDAFNGVVNG